MAANVSFYYGTKANYNALASHDDSTLYFITDTLQLYRGDEEYTKSTQFVTALPTSGARQGVIYIRSNDLSMWRYTGTAYQQINKGYVTEIPSSADDASDNNVPTTKAVAAYVNAKIANMGDIEGVFVTDVTYNASAGEIVKFKGGSGVATKLTGVVNNPTWDATTRTLNIPIFGEDALVIEFGKDAFVTSGTYNAETKNLELTLTTGSVVEIPVGSLVDIYTGVGTATTSTTISSDNKISVSVKVSASANNQITLEEDGLYVPLPDAYTKAEVDTKVNALTVKIANHVDDTSSHVSEEDRATWNAKIGSADLAQAKASILQTAAVDAQTKANQALSDAKDWANGLNQTMGNRVSILEQKITWQAIPSES